MDQADLFAIPPPAPPRLAPSGPAAAAGGALAGEAAVVKATAPGAAREGWRGRDAGDAEGAEDAGDVAGAGAGRAAGIGERPALHPAVWRAHEFNRPVATDGRCAVASGHPALDRELPGGGWPLSTLTELLLPRDGLGELRLLAPALAAVQRRSQAGRSLVWFDPPAEPCAWVLAALGLDLRQLVVVRARPALPGLAGRRPGQRRAARAQLPAADVLWALEQTLKSGDAGAVVAWLPARLPADALRRLQLAAQAHPGPAFLLRPLSEARQPSAAPLRITLASAGPDRLRLALLKRRGPPCAAPVTLALPPALHALPAEALRPPPGPAGPVPPGARDSGLQAA